MSFFSLAFRAGLGYVMGCSEAWMLSASASASAERREKQTAGSPYPAGTSVAAGPADDGVFGGRGALAPRKRASANDA
jgi:hypothetical protein